MSKKRAYSYLRVSTDAQIIGDGIRRQIEASERYAKENDYELVEMIQDIGVSGYHGVNSKTGELSVFLRALDDGKVDTNCTLIVESLDRLSRENVLTAFANFTGILSKGVDIVTLIDKQLYTEDSYSNNIGQIYATLGIMARANEESATKSYRLKSAWNNKRDDVQNIKMTRMIPSWLILNECKTEFSVKDDAADTITKIFELCVNGVGIYSITKILNGNKHKYPTFSQSDKWNRSYVSKILHNEAVIGRFQPHQMTKGQRIPTGAVIEDYYPQIITEERFSLAQVSLKKRGKNGAGRKGKTHSNIFTNLVKCGECGGTMAFRDKGKPPKGHKYLHCQNSVSNNGCTKPAWRYDEFESAFVEFVKEIDFSEILDKDKQDAQNKISGELAVAKKDLEDGLNTYDSVIENLMKVNSDAVVKSLEKKAEEINSKNAILKDQISRFEIQVTDSRNNKAKNNQARLRTH